LRGPDVVTRYTLRNKKSGAAAHLRRHRGRFFFIDRMKFDSFSTCRFGKNFLVAIHSDRAHQPQIGLLLW
jgi:hypothetical protein